MVTGAYDRLTELTPFFRYSEVDFIVKLHNIRWWATPILLYLPREIRNRTYHGPLHSHNVLTYLKELVEISGRFGFKPNEVELFVLEASAWLHDTGFIIPDEGKHALHSMRLVKKFGKKYFLLDSAERKVISWVCTSHSHDFPLEQVPPMLRLHRKNVRTQILAAIFSLADACDIHTKRAPEIVFEIIKDELKRYSRKSVRHWRANQSVDAVFFSEKEEAIFINALSLKYAHEAKKLLQKELKRVLSILGDWFPLKKVKLTQIFGPP